MTDIQLINDNGVIKGIDPETGEEVSVEMQDLGVQSIDAESTHTENPVDSDKSENGQLSIRGEHPTTVEPSINYYAQGMRGEEMPLFQDGSEIYTTYIGGVGRIFRSTDYGQTWAQKGDVGERVRHLIKLSSGTLIAFTYDTEEVYRSTDNGDTWSLVDTLTTDTIVRRNAITETSAGSVLYAEYGVPATGNNIRIRRSTDDGETWSTAFEKSTASGENPEFHSLQYDPYRTDTFVVFEDSSDTHRYLISEGSDGANWSTLTDVSVGNGEMKWIAAAFFGNHIAWCQDRTPRNGWIMRISRDDFYNGNVGAENYDFVARTGMGQDGRAGYETLRVSDDLWVTQIHGTDRNTDAGESYGPELWAIYDDGARATHLDSYNPSSAGLRNAGGSLMRLPAVPYDSTAGNDFYVGMNAGNTSSTAIQCSVTFGGKGQIISTALIDAVLPDRSPLRATMQDGSITDILEMAGSGVVFKHSQADWPASMAIRDNGTIRFDNDHNSLTMTTQEWQYGGDVNINENDLTKLAKYSDDTNAPNDSLYYDTTDTQLEYKDDGGTIHNLG